jgi:hypothetical protein
MRFFGNFNFLVLVEPIIKKGKGKGGEKRKRRGKEGGKRKGKKEGEKDGLPKTHRFSQEF